MPMSMPVTVGELADFLAYACQQPPPLKEACDEPQRWAEPRADAPEKETSESVAPVEVDDVLDWSLAQWRAHRLKESVGDTPAAQEEEGESEKDNNQSGDSEEQPASRLFVEEQPRIAGPVLVHRTVLAPPRPILCTDDPEASLLKVVELLLAYPELDAVPIVSPVRCTVVAHLTLAYCLAFMLGRLRGSDMGPLREMIVGATDAGAGPIMQCVFDGSEGEKARWAESRPETLGFIEDRNPLSGRLWVLRRSQPLRDLLTFFASTTHSGVPIVEDGSDSSCGGGLLGFLTRRDLLHYLDLSLQCARRRASREGITVDEEQDESSEDRAVVFDVTAPVEVVLDTLQRFRASPTVAQAASPEGASASSQSDAVAEGRLSKGSGTVLVYEEELSLRSLILQVLGSESRKLLFVEVAGEGAPRIRRLVSVGDAWRFLIGEGRTLAAIAEVGEAEASTTKPSMAAACDITPVCGTP